MRVAVDVGGTFTDLVIECPDGRLLMKKVPSSPGAYSAAIIEALREAAADHGLDLTEIQDVVHGTTVATNAILENKGARVALLTTRGFRDVLEIGRLQMPVLYDLNYEKPAPLVPRFRRLEIDERLEADGRVHRPLDDEDVRARVGEALKTGFDAIAICLLHAYRNPEHERRAKRVVEEMVPEVFVSVSSEVLPEIGEYERTSTTVVNAYVGPIVAEYLEALRGRLKQLGIDRPLHLMQSNGGIMSATSAGRRPAYIVESGPAAGVVGARELGRRVGCGNLIAFDMGGTTAKASVIEDGEATWVGEFRVGGPMTLGARLVHGGGYVIKLPAFDIAEVGAGGGSIVAVDPGGALRVGPESAGAVPGPVAYARGGAAPTITDANILLGYINPAAVAGGAVRLNAAKARRVFAPSIADVLGLSVEEAAFAAFSVANSNMIRAINAVSTERGRDPRSFSLLAYGGSGPVHAPAIARELGIARVVVPPAPGLFSAFGLLFARIEYRGSRTSIRLLDPAGATTIDREFEQLEREVLAEEAEQYGGLGVMTRRFADLRYEGQAYSLSVAAPAPVDAEAVGKLRQDFETEYRRSYGHLPEGHTVEVTALRVVASLPVRDAVSLAGLQVAAPAPTDGARARRAYFGPSLGWRKTPVVVRADIEARVEGPLIVEEYDATTVVPPGCAVSRDAHYNLVIDVA
jgi:N-methylhydantoinase A